LGNQVIDRTFDRLDYAVHRTPPHGIPRQQEKGKARKPDNPWMKPMQTIKLVIRMRIEFPVGMWKILKKTTLIIFKPEPLLI